MTSFKLVTIENLSDSSRPFVSMILAGSLFREEDSGSISAYFGSYDELLEPDFALCAELTTSASAEISIVDKNMFSMI